MGLVVQGFMNENSKVMVRIEYERDGVRRVCLEETDEMKLEEFHAGEEDFIWMENDGTPSWIDKQSVMSIDELMIKTRLHDTKDMGTTSQGQDART